MGAFEDMAQAVRNWGRWGPDDERGTLNHATDATRAAACGLVRHGTVHSLALPFQGDGPQMGLNGRVNPIHTMMATGVDVQQPWDIGGGARFNDDFIAMPLQCGTQWDALSHVYYDGLLYNGVPASVVDSYGAHRHGIEKLAPGFVLRAVLLDVARLHGVEFLDPRVVITTEDLDAAEAAGGCAVGPGDLVLVRTGLPVARAAAGSWAPYQTLQAGLHWATAAWFHQRDVAAVACDNGAVEAVGVTLPGVLLPFHMLALRDMGMPLGELWDLEGLAQACADDGVHECLVVAPPLPVTGAVGAPVHPCAVR